PVVDAEILGAVAEILTTLGFQDFVIRLNHRQVLTALLDHAGVPSAQHGDALIALDKLDKIGADGVANEFVSRGIVASAGPKAMAYFAGGDPAATLRGHTTVDYLAA